MRNPRYSFSCVEQVVQNPDWKGYRNFRVEVFDRKSKDAYAITEFSFTVPEALYDRLYEIWDGFETDHLPQISCSTHWNIDAKRMEVGRG